jgi:hypothetical protein
MLASEWGRCARLATTRDDWHIHQQTYREKVLFRDVQRRPPTVVYQKTISNNKYLQRADCSWPWRHFTSLLPFLASEDRKVILC